MELLEEIEKSFPKIKKLLTDRQLLELTNTARDDLYAYHFGLGAWIRNNLLLENAILYQLFIDNGITHKDDMSSFVIDKFHEYTADRSPQRSRGAAARTSHPTKSG